MSVDVPYLGEGGAITRRTFAQAVLTQMNRLSGNQAFPVTANNITTLMRWMQVEFSAKNQGSHKGGARFNPMATTWGYGGGWQGASGVHTPTHYNSHKVQHYATFEDGVLATALTLMQEGEVDAQGRYIDGTGVHYGEIRRLLSQNASQDEWRREMQTNPRLQTELNMYGGLLNSATNYYFVDAEPFPDTEVFTGDLKNSYVWGSAGNVGSTYQRIPDGHQAYTVDGKTYLVYKITPDSSTNIFFEHDQAQQVIDTRGISASAWNDMSSNWVNGGTTATGIFSDSELNNGTRTWDDIVEGLLMAAGIYGTDALQSPEVMEVIAEFIARPDMSDAELTGRLQQTDWWDQTTAAEREWNDLSTADQIKTIKDNAQTIAGLWTAYTGEQIDWMSFDTDGDGTVSVDELEGSNNELAEWARKLSTGEVNQQTIVLEWIRPAALEIPDSPANRIVIEEEQAQNERGYQTGLHKDEIQQLWERYGIDVSDADASRYADQIYMQETSLAELEDNVVKGLSNVRWAGKPEDVDFDTWASPYKTAYSNLLETGEPTFRDEQFSRFLDDGVGSEGGMSMYEFKKALRQDARWANTQNAKDTYAQNLGSLGRLMGFG